MATIDVTSPARDVLNQAPPLHPINLFESDLALVEALQREGGGWGVDRVRELAAEWEPRLTKPDYEHGALAGMAMTERQGGSDVRANITRAEPVGDGVYEIHGHKWFCSYPPCDVFLVLAQAPAGLSCL